jgi:hypothetical protein
MRMHLDETGTKARSMYDAFSLHIVEIADFANFSALYRDIRLKGSAAGPVDDRTISDEN